MEIKLIFSHIILYFYLTGVNTHVCTKPNEHHCTEDNRCESACTYQGLINYQLNKSTCICDNGFARNMNENCVEPKHCETFCGVNEELDMEALGKNTPCIKYCKCKEGFYRSNRECVQCNYPNKSYCEIFDSKTCSCTKCKNQYKFCKGRCYNNHLNCRTYDANQACKCVNCEIGFKNHEGACVKDMANCEKYDKNGKCIACQAGTIFCNNACVSNSCTGDKTFDLSLCVCVCPSNTKLCGSNCVKPECDSPLQSFSEKTCECECKEGAFPCNNSCHPLEDNCVSYKNDTCKCDYCSPGYKLCNEKCVLFECKINEYFVSAICQCACKEGFFRDENDICCSIENDMDVSVFHKLFLEMIYSFLPPGFGFCRKNEFFCSWALKYEETCHGSRTPDPTERCFCKNGFVRDNVTNTCMKVCPLPGDFCDTHEVYECGPERYCNRFSFEKESLVKIGQTQNRQLKVVEEVSSDCESEIIDDPPIFSRNKEFCGYHCNEGYGRIKSVCQKCEVVL